METIFVHLALAAYAAAAAVFLTWLVRGGPRWAQAGRWLLCSGVMVHFSSFAAGAGVAALGLGGVTWKGGQLFNLLSAFTVAGYVVLDRRGAFPIAGVFVAPLTVAVMAPAHLVGSAQHALAPQLWNSGALFLHVAAATLGTAALALAWTLLATMIGMRLGAGWRGRRIALFVVIGFALLAFAYAGLLSASPAVRGALALGALP